MSLAFGHFIFSAKILSFYLISHFTPITLCFASLRFRLLTILFMDHASAIAKLCSTANKCFIAILLISIVIALLEPGQYLCYWILICYSSIVSPSLLIACQCLRSLIASQLIIHCFNHWSFPVFLLRG